LEVLNKNLRYLYDSISCLFWDVGSITISGTSGLTQAIPTTSSSGDDEDYNKLQFQGYDAPPPLKQIRVAQTPQGLAPIQLKKKPVPPPPQVPVGNFRRIAPKPPVDDLLPIQPATEMTVGNHEIQFEDNDNDDDGQVLDPESNDYLCTYLHPNNGNSVF